MDLIKRLVQGATKVIWIIFPVSLSDLYRRGI